MVEPVQAVPAQPAPAAPISNDEAISNLAKGFLSEIERDQDPEQRDAPEQGAETPPAEGAETAEPEQPEAETPTPESTQVAMVEVELDGEKYQVPEKLKGRIMADKDYRQKTMALAETRKNMEQLTSQAAQLAQLSQQMAPYHAQLFAMDTRAQQLDQALRGPELAADPVEYNRVQGELAILLRNRDQFASGLQQQQMRLDQQQQAQTHQVRVQQLVQDAPKLFEQYPDLQKPEVQSDLRAFLVNEGVSEQELNHVAFSASATRLAWEAKQYREIVKQQASSRAKLNEKLPGLPATPQSRVSNSKDTQNKQLQKEWEKGGGKIHDPAFSQLLRNKLRG